MGAPSTLRPVSDVPVLSLLTLIRDRHGLIYTCCALCGESFNVAPWRGPTGFIPGAPEVDICGRCRT